MYAPGLETDIRLPGSSVCAAQFSRQMPRVLMYPLAVAGQLRLLLVTMMSSAAQVNLATYQGAKFHCNEI